MKILAILLLSFSAYSQNFDDCSFEVNPSICVGKKLSKQIDNLGGINEKGPASLKPGVYRYLKGHDQVDAGLRKIEVKRNHAKQLEITYYGANGAILTYFTCYNNSLICQSPNRHLMVLVKGDSFFIDWANDTNGTFQFVK